MWLVFRELPTDSEVPYAPEAVPTPASAPVPVASDEVVGEPAGPKTPVTAPGPAPSQDATVPTQATEGTTVDDQFERALLPKVALTEGRALGGRDRPRTLYVDPRVLVELDARAGSMQTGQAPIAGARLVSEVGAQRRWHLPAGTAALAAHAALAPDERARHSVVLHDAPASNSPGQVPMALLRVKFPAAWALREVERFAELHDLEGLQKLTIGPNWFSFRASSGPAALSRAEALREHEDVLAAEPDWWRPLRVR
jgi:hypothetical protein